MATRLHVSIVVKRGDIGRSQTSSDGRLNLKKASMLHVVTEVQVPSVATIAEE